MGSFLKHSVSSTQLQSTSHKMKTILAILAISTAVMGAPAPQDFPDASEVELVPVVNNEGVDYDGEEPVVIVVRPSSFLPNIPGGFGGFPGFGELPRLPASFGGFGDVAELPTINLSDIFGPTNEQPLLPANNGCGLICKVFKTLEGQLGVMQGQIDGLKTELHNKEVADGTYDNHTTTFDEKVLADGSILRTNKTTIHDSDENGNGFFFQSSIHHVLQENDKETQKEGDIAEEAVTEKEENVEVVTEEVVIGEASLDSEAIAEGGDLSEIDLADPSENEIDQKFPTLDVTDIDEGLLE